MLSYGATPLDSETTQEMNLHDGQPTVSAGVFPTQDVAGVAPASAAAAVPAPAARLLTLFGLHAPFTWRALLAIAALQGRV